MCASLTTLSAQTSETELLLLPYPRLLILGDGDLVLKPDKRIAIDGWAASELIAPARRLQNALRDFAKLEWEIGASSPGPSDGIGVRLRLDAGVAGVGKHEQGYVLDISAKDITISAPTAAGAFYGICTLTQLVQQYGRKLPALHIEDWPDFAVRGVMLDISRDKVPTMETLYSLVDMLAGWKINQLQLYTEHTFAYRKHPDVWAEASPITGEEILALDAYCSERISSWCPTRTPSAI